MSGACQVLYVDDEMDLLDLGKLFIEQSGDFSVTTMASAPAALTLLQKEKFDVIISDYQMPDMDGIQFLIEVRKNFGNLPFILFTGRGREEVVIQAINNGADFYLQKGGDPEPQFVELTHKIKKAVEGVRSDIAVHESKERLIRSESDLSIKEIELEMQAEEVKRANLALEESRDRYLDLYEFAPLAYLMLNDKGMIMDLNLTAATLLSIERGNLKKAPFSKFLSEKDSDTWHLYFMNLQKQENKQTCVLTIKREDGSFFHARLESLRLIRDGDAGATVRVAISDISDIWKLNADLMESKERFQSLYMHMIEGAALHELTYNIKGVPDDYVILEINPAFEKQVGVSRDMVIGKTSREAYGVDEPPYFDIYKRVALEGGQEVFETYFPPLDKHFLISLYSPSKGRFATIFEDITDRIRKEKRQALTLTLLQILNDYSSEEDSIKQILHAIKESTGIEAVGIRLENGEDYPYYETNGFPDTFVESERSLCGRDSSGNVKRDSNGKVILECMCGNIICGRTDPQYQFFTTGGSFWSNCTTELLASTTDQERQATTRNRCNGEGYESVALIPLRSDKKIIGLLQLNDHQKNIFSLERIQFFEGLGNTIGIALHRKRTVQELISAQNYLKEAHKIAKIGTWDWLMEKDTVTWSEELSNIAGRDPSLPAPSFAEHPRFHTPAGWDLLEKAVSRAVNTGEPYNLELEMIRSDGRIMWTYATGSVRRDNKGKVIGLHGMVQDISEIKQAEEAFRLANKKLNILTGITRHDINNQLLVIDGFVKLLQKQVPDPKLEDYFNRISVGSDRISAMIRFTKEYEEVGVNTPVWQEVHKLVETAGKEVPLGNVKVKNDIPGGSEVFADPLIIKVFYNLMDNAMRYGEKITTIEFALEKRENDYILVCEDDGSGIPVDDKEKIFEKGYGKNTGLGLFLSREILAITGITISETGEVGKGARFEMAVPNLAWRMSGEGNRK
ncbi:MAG: PAS domain S-box protein [Methanomicrobiales archaeon]